jgi:hypothetical protein
MRKYKSKSTIHAVGDARRFITEGISTAQIYNTSRFFISVFPSNKQRKRNQIPKAIPAF